MKRLKRDGQETRWERTEEREWLLTLSLDGLAGYARALPRRAVDFHGNPVTRAFLEECQLDCARAVDHRRAQLAEAGDG